MNPHAFLADQAPIEVQHALLARLGAPIRRVLLGGSQAPGKVLIQRVLEAGTVDDRAALAANLGCDPEVLAALAQFGHRQVAVELYRNGSATREVMLRAMMSATVTDLDPFSVRHAETRFDAQRRLYPLVELDDADLTARVFGALDWTANLPGLPAVILRGCVGLLDTVGADATRAAAVGIIAGLQRRQYQYVPRVVREAFADPGDARFVRHALEHERSMPVIIDRMANHRFAVRAFDLLLVAPRVLLNWAMLVEAHRIRPFDENALMALRVQHGCPPELQSRPFMPNTRPVFERRRDANRTRQAVLPLCTALGDRAARAKVREVHRRGLLSASAILADGAPAKCALMVFGTPAQDCMPDARAALGVITQATLGTQVERWAVALGLLEEFTGTMRELCAVAGAIAA
ncbi:hypothetical protein GCM10023205_61780 [Yinghuangia aomiensis]|uniref:Uncharacterized protein n=1 Tax=Yinghuangia aomiensis TaxID=676205 RepID=A0ABP9HZQ5_9ACTN